MRKIRFQWVLVALGTLALVTALACTQEVVKEVPVEKVITQEVVKEVPVEKIVEVEKETVRTVEVEKPVEVIKEVVKEVRVPGETVVVTEVEIKEVPVEKVVVREVQTAGNPGLLRVGNNGDISFLDTHRSQSGHDIWHGSMLYDTLVFYDRTYTTAIPGLATGWTLQPDGTTYDFTLRQDVTYHNGDHWTSADRIWNYDRCIVALKEKSRCGTTLLDVQKWSAPGPYELRLELNKFNVVFMFHAGGPREMHRGNTESGEVDTNPIGTGTYKFVEYIPGDRLVMEKFTDYWDKGFLAIRPQRAVILPMPETQTRIAALKTGEIDLMTDVPFNALEDLDNTPGLQLLRQTGITMSYMTLIMNTREGPMSDVRVRKAMQHAVNKEAMHNVIWFGHGEVDCNLIPSKMWAYTPTPCPARDISAATALLNDAGYNSGNPLKIKYIPEPNNEMFVKIGEVFKQNVEEIDFAEVEIEVVDTATWLDKVWFGVESDQGWPNHEGTIIHKEYDIGDAWYTRWPPDPDGLMQSVLRAGSENGPYLGNNGMRYYNAEVEELFDKGKSTLDKAVRKPAYARVVDIVVNEDVPLIKIQSMPRFYAANLKMQNAPMTPNGYLDFRAWNYDFSQ